MVIPSSLLNLTSLFHSLVLSPGADKSNLNTAAPPKGPPYLIESVHHTGPMPGDEELELLEEDKAVSEGESISMNFWNSTPRPVRVLDEEYLYSLLNRTITEVNYLS